MRADLAGVGATAGMVLARRGFAVDPIGMTLTVAIGGLVLAFEPRATSVLGDARFYAVLIAVVGAANLLLAMFAGDGVPASGGRPVAGE